MKELWVGAEEEEEEEKGEEEDEVMEIWVGFVFCFISSCSVPGGKCLLIVVCAPLSTFCFCLS